MYFEETGKVNTDETLRRALEYATENGINDIIVPTSSGEVGLKAAEIFHGFNLVVVTHAVGFTSPGIQEADPEKIEKVRQKGARVLTTTHALSGAERAVKNRSGTVQVLEIVSDALRVFGQGTKVAIEITLMAADSGLIPLDRDVVALGGSEHGLDTAWRIKPAHANNFFDLRMSELICKPTF